jgi:hypothetical protein
MEWGHGDGTGGKNGRGYIYKEDDGMYFIYHGRGGTAGAGKEMGIKILDEGAYYYDALDGEWKLIGSGGGGAANMIVLPRQPYLEDAAGLPDKSVIKVYDPSTTIQLESMYS